ncbi:Calx-beta domain-containing protein, partial [Dolichospermum planctonicum CS-1226]
MNTLLNSALRLTYNQLSTFADLDNFWNLFDTAFGTQYNRSGAEILRLQWLSGDFSQLPQIEILDSSILGNANGAYASSNNQIYLSANFLTTSTAEAISAVLLEEIGHFIDAQINLSDSAGDEGEKFSALVQGQNLSASDLARIQSEDDHAVIYLRGKSIVIEQAAPITLTVNTTFDEADGTSGGFGLSLRDAIIIANNNPNNDYIIELAAGTLYSLTANTGGDLNINTGTNVTIRTAGNDIATISGGSSAERVFNIADGGTLTLEKVIVSGGYADYFEDGAGVYNAGTLNLFGSIIANNTTFSLVYSKQNGGGIYNTGTASIVNSTIKNNKVNGDGGGIYNTGILSIVDSTIESNTADDGISSKGNGIYNAGTLSIFNSTLNDNNGISTGIYNTGSAIIANSTIKDNKGLGGIRNEGNMVILNSTISGNRSGYNPDANSLVIGTGGGILQRSGNLVITNSTISSNSAVGSGGGIYITGGATTISNTTITNNIADSLAANYGTGGGIYNNSTTSVTLKNTIIAGNFDTPNNTGGGAGTTYNPDLTGSFQGNAFNLIGNKTGTSGTIGTGTDIVNPNPKLGPLQDNGNGIFTHALLSGSPAINAGNNALVSTDVFDLDADDNNTEIIPFDNRGSGFTRISSGTVDIGAFEFQPPAPNLSLSINDVTLTEGNSGTKNATFTVTLSGETFQTVTVNYATANGTATAGSDYTATTGTLIFNVNPGETSKQITVSVLGDSLFEANETFFVNLSNATNASIADAQAQGTITNDDVALPTITLAVSPTSVSEDGTTNLIYTFTRTGATTNTLTVNYSIAGTANSTDYTGATPGTGKTITFAAGVSTATLTIDPTADTIVESNETVALTLATGTGYTIGT